MWRSTRTFATIPACHFKPKPYEGPPVSEVLAKRRQNVNPSLTANLLYSKPLFATQGHKQWIWDETGKRYLDMFAGIVTVSVGHCHPRVAEAAKSQMDSLWHTSNIYLTKPIQEFAEKLAAKMPGDLKVCYFVNSGSEANDLAMYLMRTYTEAWDIISLRNAYHGLTLSCSGLCGVSSYKTTQPTNGGVIHAMNADPFRGIWGGSHCRDSPCQTDRKCDCAPDACMAGDSYANQFKDLLNHSVSSKKIAGFFAESVQGVGGTVQFPKNYLKQVYEMVRARGGLCVADEVQTGFGRLGSHFWGFETHGVMPDIVTMAKGIGNGFPLAAVVTTPEIASCLTRANFFNTFGGNPIASAVGASVLDVIEDEGLQKNSEAVGDHLLGELQRLKTSYRLVGDVRGKGLMIGVEMVESQDTTPLGAEKMLRILDLAKDKGLLLGRGGNFGNVIRIKPPMCISKEDADFTVEVLRECLDEL